MNLYRRILQLFDTTPQLAEYPTEYERVEVRTLEVHTANLHPDTDEQLVIITTTPAALQELKALSCPLQLIATDQRAVTWVPVEKQALVVLDPNHGWIIPLHPEAREEIAALPNTPGDYELDSMHLGLIIIAAS